MDPGTVFATGEVPNSTDGINMTPSDPGRMMCWAARRGGVDDWAIYIFWADHGIQYALDCGDKVTFTDHIKKLVPCDNEALARYRK